MAKTKSKTKIKKPLLNQEEAHEITSEYLKKVDGGGSYVKSQTTR
jgi:hypothetical protein